MATTPNLERYSKELANKLRDPIANANTDGQTFSKQSREQYLSRAYGSLKRKLSSIMLGVEKVFPDFYQTRTLYWNPDTTNTDPPTTEESFKTTPPNTVPIDFPSLSDVLLDTSNLLSNVTIYDIVDLYATIRKTGTSTWSVKNLGQIHAEHYFSTLFGLNPYYKPNDANLSYFYAIVNTKLSFAGGTAEVKQFNLLFPTPTQQMQLNGDIDVNVPYEYSDLYLTLAAYEAMLDVGDQIALQKANFYNQEILNQLKIIQFKESALNKKESDRTTEQ